MGLNFLLLSGNWKKDIVAETEEPHILEVKDIEDV